MIIWLNRARVLRKNFKYLVSFLIQLSVCFFSVSLEAKSILKPNELENLAIVLAPKLQLFKTIWAIDPSAELYGGTSRTFLQWILHHFKDIKSNREKIKMIRYLKGLPFIKIQEIFAKDSDIDVITRHSLNLQANRFGIRKIDSISPDILDPKHPKGKDDIKQGYISLEKIRISKKGILIRKEFGNPLSLLIENRFLVHFSQPEVFYQTEFAQLGINHPVLLALRYLRIIAQSWMLNNGYECPSDGAILDLIPSRTKDDLLRIFETAKSDPYFFKFLEHPKSIEWMNGIIEKSFNSRTSQEGLFRLYRIFGVPRLLSINSSLKPLNPLVFAKHYSKRTIRKAWESYSTSESDILEPVFNALPDGFLYHGTKPEYFKNILNFGVLPSNSGSAGAGLYGVSLTHKGFAETWGDRLSLIAFPVDQKARYIDISSGKGFQFFSGWSDMNQMKTIEDFCDEFGIDILKYRYGISEDPIDAFVVKNAAILGHPRGVYRNIISTSEMVSLLNKGDSDAFTQIFQSMDISFLTEEEIRSLILSLSQDSLDKILKQLFEDRNHPLYSKDDQITFFLSALVNHRRFKKNEVVNLLTARKEDQAWIERLTGLIFLFDDLGISKKMISSVFQQKILSQALIDGLAEKMNENPEDSEIEKYAHQIAHTIIQDKSPHIDLTPLFLFNHRGGSMKPTALATGQLLHPFIEYLYSKSSKHPPSVQVMTELIKILRFLPSAPAINTFLKLLKTSPSSPENLQWILEVKEINGIHLGSIIEKILKDLEQSPSRYFSEKSIQENKDLLNAILIELPSYFEKTNDPSVVSWIFRMQVLAIQATNIEAIPMIAHRIRNHFPDLVQMINQALPKFKPDNEDFLKALFQIISIPRPEFSARTMDEANQMQGYLADRSSVIHFAEEVARNLPESCRTNLKDMAS